MCSEQIISGKKCAIVCYADDNKLSYMDSGLVTDILERIKRNFENLVVNQGKNHTYLGMNITIADNNKITAKMKY